jgi:3-oxosteroid 1-dehydrogenase
MFYRLAKGPVTTMADWDHTVDFLVVGSGAGAMAAALRAHDLGLDTLLVEKGDQYGGSTAMSGGVCWVGNNVYMKKYGLADSDEEVLAYLKHITKGEVPEEYLVTYRDESKRMVEYFREKTRVTFDPLDQYTDYYPEAPGGKLGGRSMEPDPIDGSLLGADFPLLKRPATSALILGKFMITARIAKRMIMLDLLGLVQMAWLLTKYLFRAGKRKRFGGRDTYLTNGNALVARLRLSLKDRGIPLWLSAPARELVREDGRVVGAVIEKDGEPYRIRSRRGVMLAAGGFDRNLAMREAYGPKPASIEWTAGNENNTGDAIQMGMGLGAAVALMDEAWWTPATQYPGATTGWVLVVEKSLPGNVFINGSGERFTNEAAPYVDVVVAMYEDQKKTGSSVPGWMVFDARYRRNYIAGPVGPGKAMPDGTLPRKLRTKFLRKASTVEELAAKIGVPAARLKATLERFNAMAKTGKDEDFGRGESASDRYYGDDRVSPNPCMAPIEKAPFYAIPLFPGDLGTKGGLRTDVHARVLDEEGRVLPGLYAAGNTTASIMGRTYPGAGGTIGPALCFGFLGAEAASADATGVNASRPDGASSSAA